MAIFISIFLALFLIFIVSCWKIIQGVLKFQKFDDLIPGPPTNFVLGNVLTFMGLNTVELNEFFLNFSEKCRKEGKSVMKYRILGKLYVIPITGKAVSKIVESTTELTKGDDYDFFLPWIGGGILVEGFVDKWRHNRKLLTPTFHFAKLEGYLEVFNGESRILIDCLDEFVDSGATVDMFPYIKRCVLDIICSAAMGTNVGAQFDHNHPYVKAVVEFNAMAIKSALNPLYQVQFIYKALGLQKQKDEYLNIMKTFTEKVIAERKAALKSGEVEKETSKRKMNMLDILLATEESNELSSEDIRQEVDTFMFAGHDTTTSAVSWACWNLAHYPEIQEKVHQELVEVFGEDEDVTLEKMNRLEYTDRVLKESKRMMTPVPMVQRKLKREMELDGVTVPAGANVAISAMMIHKNSAAFPNPKLFDPDRFLPDEIAKRNAYDFIPFSAGLRNCIGQKFAQINEKVMITHILRKFELVPVADFDATKPTLEPVARPSCGIPVKLIRR